MNSTLNSPVAKKRKKSSKNALIFYSIFIAVPVIHFLVFYVYINFNSILMAFKEYTLGDSGYIIEFAGWSNFKTAWENVFGNSDILYRLTNSLILFAVMLCVVTPLAIFFAYYLYKKAFLNGFFKVMLFMPQLLSGVVLGLLYKFIATDVYVGIENMRGNMLAVGLLSDPDTRMGAVIAFNILMGFGVNILTYTSTMSGINRSLIESAQLDGANSLQELWYIILPMIYPTVTTLMIVELSHVFTNQFHLYTLYGTYADSVSTIGYYLYVQAQQSSLDPSNVNFLSYSVLSAMGLILTAIILPVTLITRHLLQKYGPSAD